MWGLAYKDLLLMRRSLWYYAFLLVIFTVFVLIGSLDAYILSGMAMLFSYMVPLSSFSLDEAARWGEFAAATPACLRGIVDGKYLCSLLTAAGGGGAAALLICLCAALGRLGDPLGEVLLSCLFCTGLALAMEAVLLPILLRFGSKTGGYALLAVTLPVFGGMLVLWLLERKGLLALPDLTPGAAAALAWGAAALCALAYALWPGGATAEKSCRGGYHPPVLKKRPRRGFPPGALWVYWGSSMIQLRSSYQW